MTRSANLKGTSSRTAMCNFIWQFSNLKDSWRRTTYNLKFHFMIICINYSQLSMLIARYQLTGTQWWQTMTSNWETLMLTWMALDHFRYLNQFVSWSKSHIWIWPLYWSRQVEYMYQSWNISTKYINEFAWAVWVRYWNEIIC